VHPPICEDDARSGHQLLDGVGHEDLARLGYRRDQDAHEYRDAAHGPVIILDLTGVDADPHRCSESLHGVADRAPAADGGSRAVEDGADPVPGHIDLLTTVAGKLLADECDVLRLQLEPAAVAQCDEPCSRANHVDKEHRRQHTSWRALTRIQRPEGREVGRQVRDDELKDAFGTGESLEAIRTEVPQTQAIDQGVLD
jgi:hypothetical protein